MELDLLPLMQIHCEFSWLGRITHTEQGRALCVLERALPILSHRLSDDGALFEPLTSPQHSHTVLPPHISPSNIDGLPPSPSKTSGQLEGIVHYVMGYNKAQ